MNKTIAQLSSISIFSSRWKLPIHIVQLFLILVVIGLSAPRLFMKDQPRTRSNTIALGMAAKSNVFILYQLLTEHTKRFRRWRSLKANAIINGLEIIFWLAVVFLMIQGNISACVGIGCYLSWTVVGVAIVLCILAFVTFIISFAEFRLAKEGPPTKTRGTAIVDPEK